MKKILALITIGSSLIFVGCSSPPEKKAELSQKEFVNIKETQRENTTREDKRRLSGAAYEQEAYRHVLAKRRVEPFKDGERQISSENQTGRNTNAKLGTSSNQNEVGRIHGYSIYELSRWERYCGKRGKMDRLDWEFVNREGIKNMPDNLIGHCQSPKYSYTEYLSAWDNYCRKTPLNDNEKLITRTTHAPGKCAKK